MALPKLDALEGIASSELIENGYWLHLRSPADDEPLYMAGDKTKPMRALVRSYRSKAYRSKDFALQTAAIAKTRRTKSRDLDKALAADMQKERPEKFGVLLVSLDNCSSAEPGILTPNEEEKIAMANASHLQWMVDQVMECAFTDENYGAAAIAAAEEEKSSGKGAAGAAGDQTNEQV